MPKGSKITDYEKGQIRVLNDDGNNVLQTAKDLRLSRTIISKKENP